MASPYSNGYQSSGHRYPYSRDASAGSRLQQLRALVARIIRSLVHFWNQRGRRMTVAAGLSLARRLRRNLTYRRIFSFPHLLVAIWVVVLLWGERWVFHSKVEDCHWTNWENWVRPLPPPLLVLPLCSRAGRQTSKQTGLTCRASTASWRRPPPPCPDRGPATHRSALLPGPAVADQPPHIPDHRQLPAAVLQPATMAALARHHLLPRRPV